MLQEAVQVLLAATSSNAFFALLERRANANSNSHPWLYLILSRIPNGHPLWAHGYSTVSQTIVYPCCIAQSYFAREEWTWSDMSTGLFDDGDSKAGMRAFLYVDSLRLLSDWPSVASGESNPYLIHHLMCIGGILATFVMVKAGVAAALGIFVCEAGSAGFNLWEIDETLRAGTGFASRLWSVIPRGTVPYCAAPCHAAPCRTLPRRTVPCHAYMHTTEQASSLSSSSPRCVSPT